MTPPPKATQTGSTCGECRMWLDKWGDMTIVLCPLHAAAEQMLKALEGQGLLLDCLETVCVELPDVDREAAMNFIEQIAALRRDAIAAAKGQPNV